MRIPSYDDLTPSIPDVSPLDVFASVERLLPPAPPVASRTPNGPAAVTEALFACVFAPEPSSSACDALIAIARAFSPRFERYGAAAVVLDVGGLGRLLGDAQAIAAELDRAACAAAARIHVAVATTQTAALLLAMARPSLTVVTTDVGAALAPLPLTFLQQLTVLSRQSVESRTFDVLRRWGLTTIGELAALPPAELSERLGPDGPALHCRANGIDPRPLVPDVDAPRFIARMELEWPIDGLEPLSFVLARLLDPLSASLERADRGAAAVRLDLHLVDRSMHTRALQLPAAMRDARVLRTLLLLDLESNAPATAVDAVTIEIDPAPSRIVQFSLLERATPSAETIATLTARLHALVGAARCGTPVVRDTHRPDGFEMRAFGEGLDHAAHRTLDARRRTSERSGRYERASGQSAADRAVECLTPMLRRFRPPVAVRVTVAGSRPVRIAIDRRGMPGGHVVQSSGPWRTSGGWWQERGHWDRDEWDLALSDGSLCRVYRDRISGIWFLEGIVD